MREGPMNVGVFFKNTGHHIAAWRDQRAQPDAGINIEHYMDCARTAERAVFDFLFFADALGVRDGAPEAIARSAQYIAHFEPLTLLGALSAVTKKIGLVGTANTGYNAPYHIARKFASLDHLSHGRAGWNMVTSGSRFQAVNFGDDEPVEHDLRYRMGTECVEVVKALWDSWDDDAFLYDRASGLFLDPDKMHKLDHDGEFFKVGGPLNVPRAPQGYPVLFQAGSSPAGREFCARFAEGVFTGFVTIPSAQAHYIQVKEDMKRHGRRPDQMKILPGCTIFVGRTASEARDKERALAELIEPIVGREFVAMITNLDLSDIGPDDMIPWDRPSHFAGSGSFEKFRDLAQAENLTMGQFYRRLGGSHGKLTMIGTPDEVATTMGEWFNSHACDGFILQPSTMPGDLDDIVEMLVPELQSRGLMRTAYQGETLREHLGLDRPESRYAEQASTPATMARQEVAA